MYLSTVDVSQTMCYEQKLCWNLIYIYVLHH